MYSRPKRKFGSFPILWRRRSAAPGRGEAGRYAGAQQREDHPNLPHLRRDGARESAVVDAADFIDEIKILVNSWPADVSI